MVYKYPLDIHDEVVVMMPNGARVLSVQVQNGRPYIWAAVDPNELTLEERWFRIAGTGHPIQDDVVDGFIGSIQMYDGKLVFHVFEMNAYDIRRDNPLAKVHAEQGDSQQL